MTDATAAAPRPLWSEIADSFVRKTSLREGPWKLVHGPLEADVMLPNRIEWELYDLEADPGEREDRARAEPERLSSLRKEFEAYQEHLTELRERLGPLDGGGAVEAETLQQLEQLGYGGVVPK